MMFLKYQHIEKLGRPEVDGILDGTCYIFPKLDGANASIWMDENNNLHCGSRNKEITEGLQGFYDYVQEHEMLYKFIFDKLAEHFCYPSTEFTLYGEWLVPHTLKTYRKEAWNQFYLFDVVVDNHYISYYELSNLFAGYTLYVNLISPLAIIDYPSEKCLAKVLQSNTYLIEDGKGIGEGIVIKRYDYVNKYGRTTWAKMVTNDFKEKHSQEMGCPKLKSESEIESKIVDTYLTKDIGEKVIANIAREKHEHFSSKDIPRFLETVFYDFIREEIYTIIKKFKNPTINFQTLRRCVTNKLKTQFSDLF